MLVALKFLGSYKGDLCFWQFNYHAKKDSHLLRLLPTWSISFFHNNLEHEFKYLSSQTATLKSWIAIQLKFKRQTNKAKQSKLKPNRKGTWQTFFCPFLFVLHSLYTCRLICNNCKKQTGRLTRLSIVQNARGVSGQEQQGEEKKPGTWPNCWTWEVSRRGH